MEVFSYGVGLNVLGYRLLVDAQVATTYTGSLCIIVLDSLDYKVIWGYW